MHTVQEYLVRFLFDPGFQEINIHILEDASRVVVSHDCKNSESNFPLVKHVGDIHALAHFFPYKLEKQGKSQLVNGLEAYFSMFGLPPIQLIVQKLREIIQAFYTELIVGSEFLGALKLLFPHGNVFASNLIDMNTIHMEIHNDVFDSKIIRLKGEINVKKLEEMYPSLANLLLHMAEMTIALCQPPQASSKPIEYETYLQNSPNCMLQIKINYTKGGLIELCVTLVLGPNQTLLWFKRNDKNDDEIVVPQNMEVEFKESAENEQCKFIISVDGAFRVPQLGCAGSIALPKLVLELKCSSSKSKFERENAPAYRFDLTIVHMTPEKRMTALLLRPFFNLELLRFILLNHFHMQFEIAPFEPHPLGGGPEKPDRNGPFAVDEQFFDTFQEVELLTNQNRHSQPSQVVSGSGSNWVLSNKMVMFLPVPPKVITSCLSMFVGEQMASPDDIQMLIDLTAALGKDLKEMSVRLARREGDEVTAANMERELAEEAQATDQLRQQEVAKPVKPRSRLWKVFGRFFSSS